MALRIHRFIPYTEVEGPGARACIQVQGCPIRCPGCAVPFTWSESGGYEIEVDELAERILSGPKVEGVTFLGGEPFAQAKELANLAKKLKKNGLSVVTFTGYVLEDILKEAREDWMELLQVTDLLIDGPFRKDLLDTSRPWVGSLNQRYHFLTSRYKHLEKTLKNVPNRLEIRIHSDGRVFVNGLATTDHMNDLFKDLYEFD
ncbi:anaerobic ribonucleoside-triphosphate reductase activating protein [Thermolongibacillus altinsuensis]|uniref:Anaerobic ribonucleoside-triphosphate reductase activating protein n=1 Tax=Thermolongibacillus altinsuensis TaxID=575256 RepID=A0A4R1QPX4_9BACL|nr:4Fe-4S single cluster domain-containing protein [Thermolongibacillus altinsuensis]TCL52784.1 anaerobic ribonucleoside-triphosphate reductase activating protein [Thermolongibacillus altinsuensis]